MRDFGGCQRDNNGTEKRRMRVGAPWTVKRWQASSTGSESAGRYPMKRGTSMSKMRRSSHAIQERSGMSKRQVIHSVLEGKKPPYVPWHFSFTEEAASKLSIHYGNDDLDTVLDNHLVKLGSDIGFFEDVGNDCYRDVFGVVWDRSIDKDIGVITEAVLPDATMGAYQFPDPLDRRFFEGIPDRLEQYADCYRVFSIGFSLFERAWTMRGMENLLVDMMTVPEFVHDLLGAIADYNVAQVEEALKYDIDAVYFGDDWGQQHGLLMGPETWRAFLRPHLERMYAAVRSAGKHVFIHSCGDVDELFDDLIDMGVNCFNPFQPEVMDVFSLMEQYRGRLTFHGGLSTQQTLPYGSVEDVKLETQRLIAAGGNGSYILSPAHAVEGDVPLENMLALIETTRSGRPVLDDPPVDLLNRPVGLA